MSKILICALLASVAAGVPDVFVAAALARASPGKILQMIASGLLGEASYSGASRTITLGLVLQIAMSFAIALIYNIASAYVGGLRTHPLVFGALYGVVIFVVMNFVVVPNSRAHPKTRWDAKTVIAMLIVMILFGEVISFIAAAFD